MTLTPFITREGLIHLEQVPSSSLSAEALGETLAKINRFTGRTAEPFSVAAHSVLVSRLCAHKEEQVWGLLHDAHETFLGDITTPAVSYIGSQSRPVGSQVVSNCIYVSKGMLDRQIQSAWAIDLPNTDFEEVQHFDRIAFDAEMFVFFGVKPRADPTDDIDRAVDILRGLPNSSNWQAAATLWISEAERLAHLGVCKLPHRLAKKVA